MTPTRQSIAARDFPERGEIERLGPPETLTALQQDVADELIKGPRGGVYGPFRPLLHCPSLLRAVGKVGENLRYEGALPAQVREWVICVVAHVLSNVFEWDMHRPLAKAAGVPDDALDALDAGHPLPIDLDKALLLAHELTVSLISEHRVSDALWDELASVWPASHRVELITLIGYFAMVSWLMNVARTPGPVAPA